MKRKYVYPLLVAVVAAALGTSCERDVVPLPTSTEHFTVSSSSRVRFSTGNLQYQASTGMWRFAPRQYDVVGAANGSVGPAAEGWIDLFGWGTSGWTSGARACQPYDTSTSPADYLPGGQHTTSLTGTYARADWGVYNTIAGSSEQGWRTLTADEWRYLIEFRTGARTKRGMAIVDGQPGLVLLPDGWKKPSGVSFYAGFETEETNSYTPDEWAQMERGGAIFLPAAGLRTGVNVEGVGEGGYYWSSTPYDEQGASNISFTTRQLGAIYGHNRHHGYSVRLVRED